MKKKRRCFKLNLNKWLLGIGICSLSFGLYMIFVKPHVDDYYLKQENAQAIADYQSKNVSAIPLDTPTDKSKMVGYIEIKDANIKAPVYPGAATEKQLKHGLSLVEEDESVDEQNVSIAGHKAEGRHLQFADLYQVHTGSKVEFHTKGEIRQYEIVSHRKVNPTNTSVLEEKVGKPQLTLITCDDYNSNKNKWMKRSIYVAKAV